MAWRDAWRLQHPMPRVASVAGTIVLGAALGQLPWFQPILAVYAGLAAAGLLLGTRWATVVGLMIAAVPAALTFGAGGDALALAWGLICWLLFAPLAAYAVARLDRYQIEGTATPVPVLAGFMLAIALGLGAAVGLPGEPPGTLGALQVVAGGVVLAVAVPIAAATLVPPGFPAHRRRTLAALLGLLLFLATPLSFPFSSVVTLGNRYLPTFGLQVLEGVGSALAASALAAGAASFLEGRGPGGVHRNPEGAPPASPVRQP